MSFKPIRWLDAQGRPAYEFDGSTLWLVDDQWSHLGLAAASVREVENNPEMFPRVPETSPNLPAVRWLVYSREHNLWWRANRCGYTNDIALAGRYSRDQAHEIVNSYGPRSNSEPWILGPSEFAVPDPDDVDRLEQTLRRPV